MKIEKTERILNKVFCAVVAISITAVFLNNVIPDNKEDIVISQDVISDKTEDATDATESKQACETADAVLTIEEALPSSTAAQTEPKIASPPEPPPETPAATEPSHQTDIQLQGVSIAEDSSAAVITEEHRTEEIFTEETDSFLININTADAALLESLPGIGEVKSQAIIDYRNEAGLFSSIEEITNVKGIGEKTFEKISGLITV